MPKNGQSLSFSSFDGTLHTNTARKIEPNNVFGFAPETQNEGKSSYVRARAPALKFYLEKQVEANLLKDKEITKSVGEW